MSMYLFDEQPILANKTLAREIGLNEALVLQLINCWIKINKRSGNNYFEGIVKDIKDGKVKVSTKAKIKDGNIG